MHITAQSMIGMYKKMHPGKQVKYLFSRIDAVAFPWFEAFVFFLIRLRTPLFSHAPNKKATVALQVFQICDQVFFTAKHYNLP